MSQLGNEIELTEKDGSAPKNPLALAAAQKIVIPDLPEIDFIDLLPYELVKAIFEFLRSKDLQHVAWMNRIAYEIACGVQTKRYHTLFSKSVLWFYLPTIVLDVPEFNGIPFIDYVLSKSSLRLSNAEMRQVNTLSGLWSAVIEEHQDPRDCTGLPVDSIYALKALAEVLLRYRVTDNDKAPTNFEEFMVLRSELSDLQVFRLYTVYRDLEAFLSTLLVFFEASIRNPQKDRTLPIGAVKMTIEGPLLHWLSGCSLVALNSYSPGFFLYVITRTLEMRRAPRIADGNLLEKMEKILDRLSEEDLLDFISPPHMFTESKIFFEILDANYELLLRKYSSKLIISMLMPRQLSVNKNGTPQFSNSSSATRILKKPLLVERLNNQDLLYLLCEIDPKDFPAMIAENPTLASRLTFEVLNQWLDDDPMVNQELAKIIIDQRKHLLLSDSQLKLIGKYSDYLYNSDHCKGYLAYSTLCRGRDFNLRHSTPSLSDTSGYDKPMILDQDYQLNSHLIYKTVILDNFLSMCVIHKRLTLLENNELINFSKIFLRNVIRFPGFKLLLQRLPTELKTRADSLCSSQWLELGLIDLELGRFIAKEYLQYFDDKDLGRFARAYKFDIAICIAVKKERDKRYQERNVQEANSKKESIDEIKAAWVEVKEASEQLQSIESFNQRDIEQFDAAINAAYLATKNPNARNLENLTKYAQTCQSKTSGPWIYLGIALLGLAVAIAGVLAIAFSAASVGFFAAHTLGGGLGGLLATEIGLAAMLTGIDEYQESRPTVSNLT